MQAIITSPLTLHHFIVILLIGITVGFLSGLLGKGGSAITTPALQIFAGIPAFIALASPLPSTLPTTLSASLAYKKEHILNKRVVVISVLTGIPATLLGSLASPWAGGDLLMLLTALFVCALGISFLIPAFRPLKVCERQSAPATWKIVTIALSVGGLSGLLANGGGVLFGPLFIRVLKLPTKQALACSLLVAAGLAIPGTLAHWWLGHINWWIVLILSIGSAPGSYLGAQLAIHLPGKILELIFGVMLVVFGAYDLYFLLSA